MSSTAIGSQEAGPLIRVVAAVVEREGRYLIAQRNPQAVFPLYWEFPGGKVEPGEDDEAALRREMMEELGVVVSVGPLLERKVHCYSGFSVDFRAYHCTIEGGELRALHCAGFAWVPLREMASYRFPPADEDAIALLMGLPEKRAAAPETHPGTAVPANPRNRDHERETDAEGPEAP